MIYYGRGSITDSTAEPNHIKWSGKIDQDLVRSCLFRNAYGHIIVYLSSPDLLENTSEDVNFFFFFYAVVSKGGGSTRKTCPF